VSAGSTESRFQRYQKNWRTHESPRTAEGSLIPVFRASRCLGRAFILFYGSALSCAPSYCVRCLSICVSNKTSEPGTIFSSSPLPPPLSLSLSSSLFLSLFALNQKGTRARARACICVCMYMYAGKRIFGRGTEGGGQDSKSDLPSGKMLCRIRFLLCARREIRFSSKVYFAVRRSGTSNILRADLHVANSHS